ncbi:DgyrCDS5893 [Dimorphilus gyrociliatus]|uniref:DgyrCDS5893 n=1 Tax=Dimorphilus gyrociliatus TaxID=2664684 RepID=A0A7I8VLB1_9ANNE|nr:DgyrCDS5893 [Dimorphilus gyrociliatus]
MNKLAKPITKYLENCFGSKLNEEDDMDNINLQKICNAENEEDTLRSIIQPRNESDKFLFILFKKKNSLSVSYLRYLISQLHIFQPKIIIGIILLTVYKRIIDEEPKQAKINQSNQFVMESYNKLFSLTDWYERPSTKTKRRKLLKSSPSTTFDHIDKLDHKKNINQYVAVAVLEESLYILDNMYTVDWRRTLIQDVVVRDEENSYDISTKAERLVGIASCLIQKYRKIANAEVLADELLDDEIFHWMKDIMYTTKPLKLRRLKEVLNKDSTVDQFTLLVIQLLLDGGREFNVRLLLKMEESSVRINLTEKQAFDLLIKGSNVIDHLMNIYFDAFEKIFENIYVIKFDSGSALPELPIFRNILQCPRFKPRQDLWDSFVSPLLEPEIFPSWTNNSKYTPNIILDMFDVIFKESESAAGPSQRMINFIFQILSRNVSSLVDLKIVGRTEAYQYYASFYCKFFAQLVFYGFLFDDFRLSLTFHRHARKHNLHMNFLYAYLEMCNDKTFHQIIKQHNGKCSIRSLFSIARWKTLRAIKKPIRRNLRTYLQSYGLWRSKLCNILCFRTELDNIKNSI